MMHDDSAFMYYARVRPCEVCGEEDVLDSNENALDSQFSNLKTFAKAWH